MPRGECVVVLSMLLFDSVSVSAVGHASDLSCLEEMELPRFAVFSMVPRGGVVQAEVDIGDRGKVEQIRFQSTDWRLEREVEVHLRRWAKYKESCVGKQVQLKFEFRIEGKPTSQPVARIVFRPPNEFLIMTQPTKAIIDYSPLPADTGRKR